ncbi:hypothetical protein H5410_039050, partial [Solanum commersonii]
AGISEVWSNRVWKLSYRRALNDWDLDRFAEFLNTINQFIGTSQAQGRLGWITQAFSQSKQLITVACFVWLVVEKACLTQDRLQKGNTTLLYYHLCGNWKVYTTLGSLPCYDWFE